MRDKTHKEQIERWANHIMNIPKEEWKPGFDEFINAQFDLAYKFYNNLEKTEEGRRILERLKRDRIKKMKKE